MHQENRLGMGSVTRFECKSPFVPDGGTDSRAHTAILLALKARQVLNE